MEGVFLIVMFKRLLMQNSSLASSLTGLLTAGIVSLIVSIGGEMSADTTATVSALCGSLVAWGLAELTNKINQDGIKKIQGAHDITVDGWAGPETQEAAIQDPS